MRVAQACQPLVSHAAVILGGALRDETNNGCVGDWSTPIIAMLTGGVRHEIRPIRMRYLINSFREHKQHSGEVSVLKISSLTKTVIFFRGRNSFGS